MMRTPDDAMEVYVVGKQWMWHLQHPEGGQREINELHVPVGRPVKLIMTSEDVIHDFFVPAFRVKQDVVPGRYTYMWFQATKAGDYHLFCAQYCGTQHSRMGGWVHVMEPDEYQKWLSSKADLSMALRGRQLFLKYQCIACHSGDSKAHAPLLEDLYRKQVSLDDGRTVEANEDYIRRVDPRARRPRSCPATSRSCRPSAPTRWTTCNCSNWSPSSRTSAATRRRRATRTRRRRKRSRNRRRRRRRAKSPSNLFRTHGSRSQRSARRAQFATLPDRDGMLPCFPWSIGDLP